MSDLEERVKRILDREAVRAPRVTEAPARLGGRVRRRQLRTGTVAVLSALAVALAGVAGVRAILPAPGRPADAGPSGPRSSVIDNVEVTFPSGWSLMQLNEDVTVGTGPVGPTGTIAGHSLFELSSVPLSSELSPCEWAGDGGVVMYLQQIRSPRIPGSQPPPWPVSADGRAGGYTDPTHACRQPIVPPRYATWEIDGRIFEAFITGPAGPSLDRMLQVFARLRFGPAPASWALPAVPGGDAAQPPLWILDTGVAEGQRWNLLAFSTSYPFAPTRLCIGLAVNGTFLPSHCDMNMSLNGRGHGAESGFDAEVVRVNAPGSTVAYAYGGLSPADATITYQTPTGRFDPPIVSALPPALPVPIAAMLIVASADASGAVESDAGQGTFGAAPFYPSSTSHVDAAVALRT